MKKEINEINETNELLNIEEIEKEQLEIYPEGVGSEKCDIEINKLYKIKDWSEMFYYGKTKLIKERFLNIIYLNVIAIYQNIY